MLALLLSLAAAAPAARQDVPKNDGWVTDLADMLTPEQERGLENLMESYRAGTTHEIALLTVPKLGGGSLEEFSLRVAREWGIGGEDANNGALLVVAKAERKMRIEVGRGLEGQLTDSVSGRIIRDVIRPRFKQGSFHRGLREGVEAMHAAIGGDYGPIRRRHGSGAPQGMFMLGMFAFVVLLAMTRAGRRRRGGRGLASPWPWLLMGGATSSWSGGGGGFSAGGGFGGFGGGGGFSGGGASGGW